MVSVGQCLVRLGEDLLVCGRVNGAILAFEAAIATEKSTPREQVRLRLHCARRILDLNCINGEEIETIGDM